MKLLLILAMSLPLMALSDLISQVEKAEKTYSLKEFPEIRKNLQKWIEKNPDDLNAKYWLARACLGQCNIERFFRRELPETKGKNIQRPETAKIAEQGIAVISEALKKKADWAEGYRVRGELHSHTIVGFLTGMRNGPKALKDITKSLELDDKNFFANIAQAKMFYYNPPISGGDVNKGILTCKKAAKLGGKDKAYTLLGRCYIKKGRAKRSILYLRKALRLNPSNVEAEHFLQVALNAK